MCIDVQCITCSLQHLMVEYLYDHNQWSICRFAYKDSILCNRKINIKWNTKPGKNHLN